MCRTCVCMKRDYISWPWHFLSLFFLSLDGTRISSGSDLKISKRTFTTKYEKQECENQYSFSFSCFVANVLLLRLKSLPLKIRVPSRDQKVGKGNSFSFHFVIYLCTVFLSDVSLVLAAWQMYLSHGPRRWPVPLTTTLALTRSFRFALFWPWFLSSSRDRLYGE